VDKIRRHKAASFGDCFQVLKALGSLTMILLGGNGWTSVSVVSPRYNVSMTSPAALSVLNESFIVSNKLRAKRWYITVHVFKLCEQRKMRCRITVDLLDKDTCYEVRPSMHQALYPQCTHNLFTCYLQYLDHDFLLDFAVIVITPGRKQNTVPLDKLLETGGP
jgi:hypothetical protein